MTTIAPSNPARAASANACPTSGRPPSSRSSLGVANPCEAKREPRPAAGMTTFTAYRVAESGFGRVLLEPRFFGVWLLAAAVTIGRLRVVPVAVVIGAARCTHLVQHRSNRVGVDTVQHLLCMVQSRESRSSYLHDQDRRIS